MVRFPGAGGGELVEFGSWPEAEAAIRARGYDPTKAKVHSRSPPASAAGSQASRPASAHSSGASSGAGDGIKVYNPRGLAIEGGLG